MKNMKKLIILILVIEIIINFIFLNYGYASEDTPSDSVYTRTGVEVSETIGEDVAEAGVAARTQGNEEKTSLSFNSFGTSVVGFVVGMLARLIDVAVVIPLDVMVGQLTYSTEGDSETGDNLKYFITVDRLVFNRVPILNINYFNTDDTYKVGDLEIESNASNKAIKENIAKVYYICRILALAIGLVVLVYIGIRMVISTVASDKARYKKMIISWIESILIIFLIPYLISFIIIVSDSLTGSFFELRNTILETKDGTDEEVFENIVRSNTFDQVIGLSGLEMAMWSIFYWVLLYTEIKFLWVYTKRFFMVGFLIAIAPLVTITYSIDKVGDGRAQAFSNWTKEFALNVLIQPLHAIIYLVIVLTANNIAETSPLISIALLLLIGSVEKMVKVVFNMNGSTTIRSLKDRIIRKG